MFNFQEQEGEDVYIHPEHKIALEDLKERVEAIILKHNWNPIKWRENEKPD